MGEIKVRRLEDWVIDVYRHRAARSGQSVEEEVRQALKADALKAQHAFARESRARLEEMRAKYGDSFDSVALIRAVRDEE